MVAMHAAKIRRKIATKVVGKSLSKNKFQPWKAWHKRQSSSKAWHKPTNKKYNKIFLFLKSFVRFILLVVVYHSSHREFTRIVRMCVWATLPFTHRTSIHLNLFVGILSLVLFRVTAVCSALRMRFSFLPNYLVLISDGNFFNYSFRRRRRRRRRRWRPMLSLHSISHSHFPYLSRVARKRWKPDQPSSHTIGQMHADTRNTQD